MRASAQSPSSLRAHSLLLAVTFAGAVALAGSEALAGTTANSGTPAPEPTCFNDSQGLGVICTAATNSDKGGGNATSPVTSTDPSSDGNREASSTSIVDSTVQSLLELVGITN